METKERITEGAGMLFFRMGVKRITLDEVAKDLRISKRTIYEHFDNKTALLKASIERYLHRQEEGMQKIQHGGGNALEVMVQLLDYGLRHSSIIQPVYFYDLQKIYPEIWQDSVVARQLTGVSTLENILGRGKDEKLFREEINIRVAALIFNEQMKIINNQEVFPYEEFSRGELFENVLLNFVRGLLTREGIKCLEDIINRSSDF